MPSNFSDLQAEYDEFIARRDWEQFHSPQNVAMAISVEANELLECFLWHDNVPASQIANDPDLLSDIEDELADVLIYSMSMASRLDINLEKAMEQKLEQNRNRFDEEKAAQITENLERWQR